jgi:hypothetical protein
MARYGRAGLGATIPLFLLVVGCSSATPPHVATQSAPSTTTLAAPTATVSTPTSQVVSQTVRVVAVHASATAAGTVAFVVVSNDGTPRAPVIVSVTAASSNGRAPVAAHTAIPVLGADETGAAMVKLAVPADDIVSVVTATATGAPTALGGAGPLSVNGAVFATDPILPTVNVTVSTSAQVAATVLAVCYSSGALIGGGVLQSTTLHPGPPLTLRLNAAVTETPTRCLGFAYPG